MKKCWKCKLEKQEAEFHKDSSRPDGLCGRCKTCDDARSNTPGRRLGEYKRGAKRRKIEFALSKDEFMSFWGQECVYCGDVVSGVGIDRIDPAGGYTLDNVAPCCGRCNMGKRTMTADEFIAHCKKIAKNHI